MNYVCEKSVAKPEDLRFPHRQNYFAAGNRARADVEAAQRRPHRSADEIQVVANRAAFQGVSREEQDGKIGFEFEKKEPKPGAKTAVKRGAAAAAPAESGDDEGDGDVAVAAKKTAKVPAKKAPAKKAAAKKKSAKKTG